MKYEVLVDVMPLEALLDPQGKAVLGTIRQLGYDGVSSVRIGKHIALQVEAESIDAVRGIANGLSIRSIRWISTIGRLQWIFQRRSARGR